MKKKIKIGFEVKTGKEINIKSAHTVITGLTHESGKTTALMGLIKRGDFKAIIIRTKIGEKAITEGTVIPPFYKEDFDWEYASELLESSRKEKLKFEKGWIIRYCKNANSLLEFKKNIDQALTEKQYEGTKLKGLDINILSVLQAYLEKILPELQFMPLSKTLDLKEGINIMDLERFKEETQGLIIRSVLNEVLGKEKNTLIVIPECWKYLPEGLGNPVKRPAESFIRQGATNSNFLFLDSQDVTGVSKKILKQVSNWILGYQREINEIKRTLDQIPLPKKSKPKPEDIATLKLGHFFVATKDLTTKIYAQPVWLHDKKAIQIAKGELDVEDMQQPSHSLLDVALPKQEQMPSKENIPKIDEEKIRKELVEMRNDFFNKIQTLSDEFRNTMQNIFKEIYEIKQQPKQEIDEEELISKILQKIDTTKNKFVADKDALIQEIMSKIPKSTGGQIFQVSPLEKIKKDFLEETKEKLLTTIGNLKEDQKKMLKWIEQNGKNTKKAELFLNCFGKSYTSGQGYQEKSKKILEMKNLGLVRIDTQQRIFPYLKERIKQLIAQYNATDEEIDQVYNHILHDMVGE